jgi:nucleoside-diphosphate-sugar epimerase
VGQIGSDLTLALRRRYGAANVVAAGHRTKPNPALRDSGPFEYLDVTQPESILAVIKRHAIDTIVHLATILSAVGEQNPQLAWHVNLNGLYNVLEIARECNLTRVFWPSSIAVFGAGSPRDQTSQDAVLLPSTMYGVTKVAGESLCRYYARRFGLDVRGVRYPGIISSETLPGGGTTDYAVAIFYEATCNRRYTCFVREDTVLPMMYMPDCIKATLDLLEVDKPRLKHCAEYNLAGMSFSAGELADEIKKHIPEFTCDYKPDFRQAIADSWPRTIDDSAARCEWGWEPSYDLASMTADMLLKLGQRHAQGCLYRVSDDDAAPSEVSDISGCC